VVYGDSSEMSHTIALATSRAVPPRFMGTPAARR
jgi:hypothetical protein